MVRTVQTLLHSQLACNEMQDVMSEEPSDTVIFFFSFFFSSSIGELCSQPIRGNDRPIGRMFPEHVERSFLDPNIASPNTSN